MIDVATNWFLPEWAPNAHPLLVHFPIALLTTGVFFDLLGFALSQHMVWRHSGTALYVIGTALMGATYITGREAAATVFTPGLAHGLVDEHWTWATFTLGYFTILTLGRLATHGATIMRSRLTTASHTTLDTITNVFSWRPAIIQILFFVAGVGGLWLLMETGGRGGQLVYEYGVGVMGAL